MAELYRALCQYRGALVIMECKPNPDGGSCFECGGTKFFDDNGWARCEECGFAILETDRVRIQNEYTKRAKEPKSFLIYREADLSDN